MPVVKELMVKNGSYTNGAGEEKSRWERIGEIHTGQNGEYMVLYPHINLAAFPRREGDNRLFVSMFDPRPRDNAPATSRNARPAPASHGNTPDFDDDIPF